jgi:molecular chaperone DnaJ
MAANYYLVLGVGRDANLSQIKRAFRALSHQFHPDRAGPGGVARFMTIKEAYDTLSDAARRADYERELSRREEASRGRASRRRGMMQPMTPPLDLFGAFETFRPDRETVRDRWDRNFTHRHEPKSHVPRELNVEVVLSPAEAARGGAVPIDVPVARVCEMCEGTGTAGYYDCDVCQGHGVDWETARVDVLLWPPVRDGTIIDVPLRHLGVQNFYLRVHVRVA